MSNFRIFNQEHLKLLVEPFLPGGTPHITPIRYQAITPDIFALLFRTTGKNDQEYFFVALEFDYLRDLAAAEQIIREWCGSEVREFIAPAGAKPVPESTFETMRTVSAEPYHVLMAIIEKPHDLGYWSEHIVLRPGDTLTEKLIGFTDNQIGFVQKFVAERSRPKVESPETNTTEYVIAVYKNNDGRLEIFFS